VTSDPPGHYTIFSVSAPHRGEFLFAYIVVALYRYIRCCTNMMICDTTHS